MPRGDKTVHTDKQKREADHIEEDDVKRGAGERRAWAIVNKPHGGGEKAVAGRANHAGNRTRH